MLILLLSFQLMCVCASQIEEGDPQYILNMDSSIYVCPDEDSQAFMDTSEIEIHRHNETTTYLSGILKLLETVNRQTIVELLVEKESSGRHELVISIEICDLCDELGNPGSPYTNYFKYFGFPADCPLEAKEYNVDNFVPDTNALPINSANVGRYQATINFYHNPSGICKDEKNFLACLKLDLVVEVI